MLVLITYLTMKAKIMFRTFFYNLKQIGLKYKLVSVARILVFGIAVNNKLTSPFITSVISSAFLIFAETTHLSSLTIVTSLYQVSFAMTYTCFKSKNVL